MEINLKDLAKKIILQWRLLMIGILVLAVTLAIYGGVQSVRAADEAKITYQEQKDNGVPPADRIKIPKVSFASPKWIGIGAALGLVVASGVIAVEYVVSGKLRSAGDLSDGCSVSVLGIVAPKEKKRFFGFVDRFLAKLLGAGKVARETKLRIIATDIAMAAKAKGLNTVYFTGNAFAEIPDEVAKAMKGSGVKVSVGELAIYSPERLAEMLASDGVVLFERVGYSAYGDIQKELAYCDRYSIPVIGSVVIE